MPRGWTWRRRWNTRFVDVNAQGAASGLRETVPAGQMQRLTANVDLSSPRGLPVFFALQNHLTDAVRTLKATGRIVEFRARIAMIRRHVNATRESVQQVVETIKGDGGSPMKTARMYPYAAIIDASDATAYEFPNEAAPVDKNVAAIQAELRAAAAALGMPEYMLSGDASNANYSSTMVAEGPAVKTFEALQAELIEADVEVIQRALVVAAAAGRIAGALRRRHPRPGERLRRAAAHQERKPPARGPGRSDSPRVGRDEPAPRLQPGMGWCMRRRRKRWGRTGMER